jgi:mono/diheme cytochrome c family protein
MKRILLTAATLTLLTLGMTAGGRALQAPAKAPAPAAPGAAATTSTPATPIAYQEMLNKYCITCHNQKAKIPAGAPLALDLANLKDPGSDAAVWEKVVRKLGVGAMPPQGSATPGAAELNKFRSSLIASLDDAAAKKNNPGHYVLHRLNRTEYANAVRDLLGVDFDVAELLPSDGGDFGFDNIASALKSTPMLLEGYLTAALRISDLAVGDAEVAPGIASFSISTVVTQTQHMEGLPLGTRGGTLVHYNFPADGEYVFYGRLLRTVAEGLYGR